MVFVVFSHHGINTKKSAIFPLYFDENRGLSWVKFYRCKRQTNKAASIDDLRQMNAYARFWKMNKVDLFYPWEF